MFRIDPEPKFWTDVKVKLPGEPAQVFKARFKVLPTSAAAATDFSDAEKAAKFLTEALCDVAEIEDANGRPAAFGATLVAALLEHPHVLGALMRAYAEGVADAALGN